MSPGKLFNSTDLCGHSEECGQYQSSCAASVLFDVSNNPVSDVNIGQNGQILLLLFEIEWLEPSTDHQPVFNLLVTHCMLKIMLNFLKNGGP